MTKRTVKQKSKGTKTATRRTARRVQKARVSPARHGATQGEKPVDDEIRRAAARAGVVPTMIGPDTDAETALAYLKDRLVSSTDLVSESLASIESQSASDTFDPDGIRNNLTEVLLALWEIRWECFAMGGEVGVKKALAEGGAS